jgi:hypothetical protein
MGYRKLLVWPTCCWSASSAVCSVWYKPHSDLWDFRFRFDFVVSFFMALYLAAQQGWTFTFFGCCFLSQFTLYIVKLPNVLFNNTGSCIVLNVCRQHSWYMTEYGALVEWLWQGKAKLLGDRPDPVPLCLPQIPHVLALYRTRASAVRGQQLTNRLSSGMATTVKVIPYWNCCIGAKN